MACRRAVAGAVVSTTDAPLPWEPPELAIHQRIGYVGVSDTSVYRTDRSSAGVWSLVSSILYRLGRWAFRARRLVLALWLAVLVLAGGSAALFYHGTSDAFSLPGTESGAALDRLNQTFPQVSGSSAQLVVVAPTGGSVTDTAIKTPVEAAVKAAAAVPGVTAVTDPFGGQVSGGVSSDGSAALVDHAAPLVVGHAGAPEGVERDALDAPWIDALVLEGAQRAEIAHGRHPAAEDDHG